MSHALRPLQCTFHVPRYNERLVLSGVEPDPSKIQSMMQWSAFSSPKSLLEFLGLTRFYWSFVKNYAHIVDPVTHLLRKDQFVWSPEAQLAFDNLKQAMTTTLVLSLSDSSVPFIVKTDESRSGMGVVLMQRGHQIAFFKTDGSTPANSATVTSVGRFGLGLRYWSTKLSGSHGNYDRR
ncbi:uncharacterized mitochondrial protein AtMg00860-like [Glycine max]|uniref:uncharacterized mitochondrial protein AtMg00860-like n=1 Tax=Glycine max TaxID=3847 RepID=UPI000719167C|nr:uncharacterized mitochondrial protein AtMg00860-like [Glycine max]|eukprot:XP_014630694.1 uncharacterized protein LOC106798597 [Glycine max]